MVAAEATGYHGISNATAAGWRKWRRPAASGSCCRRRGNGSYRTLADELRRATLAPQGCPRRTGVLLRRQPCRRSGWPKRSPVLAAEVDALAVVSVEHSRDHRGDRCLLPPRGVSRSYALLSPLGAGGAGGLCRARRRRGGGERRGGHGPDGRGPKARSVCWWGRRATSDTERTSAGSGTSMARHAPDRHLCQSIMYLDDEVVAFEAALGVCSARHTDPCRALPFRRRGRRVSRGRWKRRAGRARSPISATRAAPRARRSSARGGNPPIS